MSLICDETKCMIPATAQLYAGTRSSAPFFAALSAAAVNRIPAEARLPGPRADGDSGVDIHLASASVNSRTNCYALCDYELGDFLFSLSRANALRYLPGHYHRYIDPDTN